MHSGNHALKSRIGHITRLGVTAHSQPMLERRALIAQSLNKPLVGSGAHHHRIHHKTPTQTTTESTRVHGIEGKVFFEPGGPVGLKYAFVLNLAKKLYR